VQWVLVVAAVLVALGLYLSWTAGRLDRTHARVDASRAMLDAEFLRRSASTLEFATSGVLDPASSVLLADAASRARTVDEAGRDQAESDLTVVLTATFGELEVVEPLRFDAESSAAVDELASACRRAAHARRFHNEMVRSALRLRRKRVVRMLGLAGHAPWPEMVELDDAVPAGLDS
jgi:hypothetical protein